MAENITYNTELEKLLKENSEECESLSILHRMSFEKYNRLTSDIDWIVDFQGHDFRIVFLEGGSGTRCIFELIMDLIFILGSELIFI